MVHAFDDALTLADRDYAVKVVVIKANGKGFCAGHAAGGGYTYPEFAENLEHWDSVWKAQADLFLWPTLRLWEFRKPTIAQVHGYALGGGTYWALLPDITVASDGRVLPDAAGAGPRLPRRRDHDRAVGVHELEAHLRVPLHRADAHRRRRRSTWGW